MAKLIYTLQDAVDPSNPQANEKVDAAIMTAIKDSVNTLYDTVSAATTPYTKVYTESAHLTNGVTLSSNTHIVGKPGVVLTCDITQNRSGFKADNATNITIEGITFDLATANDDGTGNSQQSNFTTAIDFRNCTNIKIINCHFINSNAANADPDWTLQATNFQNVNGLHILGCTTDGAQFKLLGASASLENLFFCYNKATNVTQMGVSIVVQPVEGANLVLRNLNIVGNTFENIDNHGIYIGVDNGNGLYPGTVTIENVNIVGNTVHGLSFLNTGKTAKAIFLQLTRTSRQVNILGNSIRGTVVNDAAVMGMHLRTVEQDATATTWAKGVNVVGNTIYNVGSFHIYAERLDRFALTNNYCEEGRGIRAGNSKNGKLTANTDGGLVDNISRIDADCVNVHTIGMTYDDTDIAALEARIAALGG